MKCSICGFEITESNTGRIEDVCPDLFGPDELSRLRSLRSVDDICVDCKHDTMMANLVQVL